MPSSVREGINPSPTLDWRDLYQFFTAFVTKDSNPRSNSREG